MDLLTLVLEFFRTCIYERYIENSSFMNNWTEIYYDKGIYGYVYKCLTLIDRISDFIIEKTPTVFLKYVRTALDNFKHLCNIRLMVNWFPNINPWRGPWPLITEPVDFIIRPFYYILPKIAYVDVTMWFVFFALDTLISLLDFLIKMSSIYHK